MSTCTFGDYFIEGYPMVDSHGQPTVCSGKCGNNAAGCIIYGIKCNNNGSMVGCGDFCVNFSFQEFVDGFWTEVNSQYFNQGALVCGQLFPQTTGCIIPNLGFQGPTINARYRFVAGIWEGNCNADPILLENTIVNVAYSSTIIGPKWVGW